MKRIKSINLRKSAALPPNVKINLDPDEQQIFDFIRAACDDIGTITGNKPTARVAGGWIRDKFLNKQSKDIDITVDIMGGDQFASWLHRIAQQRYGQNQKIVTEAKTTEERPEQIKNLAVAFLRIFGQDIEILPLRGKEVYEEGNRNPVSTEKVGPESDAYRRDLTINSLFYNINTGAIEDFTGTGYDDLLTMTLRTPTRRGHQPAEEATRILTEDPLRLLRILRFHARYPKSQIAPEVLMAMKNPEIQHQVVRRLQGDTQGGIVPERTADEMRKIFMGEQPEAAIRTMFELGLLQKLILLPSGHHPLDMDQQSDYHSLNVINHTISVIKNVNNLSQEFGLDDKNRMMMNFAALFHDLGKLDPRSHYDKPDKTRGYFGDPNNPESLTHQQASEDMWKTFSEALKLSDEERSMGSDLVSTHMNPHAHVEENVAPSDKQLRKYLRKNPSWVFQYIHAMADAMSKGEEPESNATDPYRDNLKRLRDLAPQADEFGNTPPAQDILNGRDIIQIVGLPPRPPQGMTGYIEIIKEFLREQQDINPQFTPVEATNLVQQMAIQGSQGFGLLAPYFQNTV